jgi:hypothetical protein
MGLREFFRALKTRRRFARIEREWNGSERKREIEAECALPPRPLSVEEENLLRWILEHGSEEARSFLPQIEGMKAVRSCTCGCPTIRLVVADGVPLGSSQNRILCDLVGRTANGELIGLLLFQGGGELLDLEVYSLDGEAGPPEFGFPTIESFRDFRAGDPAQSGL